MTPNRKNNKHSPSAGIPSIAAIKTNNTSYFTQSHSQQQRNDHASRTLADEKYPHPTQSFFSNQKPPRKTQHMSRGDSEFIPVFVLADASRENSDRKVREICRKLLMRAEEEAEPVVNFQDPTGRTALSYGCGCGNITIIEEISRIKFADPNVADNDGNAPLHYSSVCGHSEGVDLLLTRFHNVIDVNVRNTSGLTPLMKAALQGRTRCAKSLLAAGASPFLKDHIRGLTAAEWAHLCGRHMCAEIINRSASTCKPDDYPSSNGSSLVYSKTFPNISDERCRNLATEETPYYHLYARSTVSGAKWLKNKIRKVLGGIRSGEDKSYVYDNPAVRSLADRRPTIPDRNYSVLTNLGLGGAAICASSLLLPDIHPLVDQQRRPKVIKKLSIPMVQITPVRR